VDALGEWRNANTDEQPDPERAPDDELHPVSSSPDNCAATTMATGFLTPSRACGKRAPKRALVRLTYIPISAYDGCMARTSTTTDAFNAVAEASRRDLLDALGTGEATVGELVDRVGLSQPQVSKHLGVLRAVGLVLVRADGRYRWYRVNGPALKPISDWVRTWNARLDRLDDLLAELQAKENTP
jgi:DNA-binding transcriptional ArsR family regulator